MTINLCGAVFDRLTVLRRGPGRFWECLCTCGRTCKIRGDLLRGGITRSCGCLRAETRGNLKHGHAAAMSPEYVVWQGMMQRCADVQNENYGGRGIFVCERWSDFRNFLIDMGERPSLHHSLDRYPDKNGPYTKSNCRWATRKEQQRNTRANVTVKFRGVEMLLIEAVEMVGTPYHRAWQRIKKGWPAEKAILEPPQPQNKY